MLNTFYRTIVKYKTFHLKNNTKLFPIEKLKIKFAGH